MGVLGGAVASNHLGGVRRAMLQPLRMPWELALLLSTGPQDQKYCRPDCAAIEEAGLNEITLKLPFNTTTVSESREKLKDFIKKYSALNQASLN